MDKEKALKLVLDDLMAEYGMERTSFAKRVDEISKPLQHSQLPRNPRQLQHLCRSPWLVCTHCYS